MTLVGFSGFQNIVTPETFATASLSSSNCFNMIAGAKLDMPVTLLPDRASVATNFDPTGSPDVIMTIGMVVVAFIAAAVAVEFVVTMTSTGSSVSCFANWGRFSSLP